MEDEMLSDHAWDRTPVRDRLHPRSQSVLFFHSSLTTLGKFSDPCGRQVKSSTVRRVLGILSLDPLGRPRSVGALMTMVEPLGRPV